MPALRDDCAIGPLRAAWFEHPHGSAAEPRARAWLATVFGIAPAIGRDPHCRPRLEMPGVDANWSHTGDRLLVVLGRGLRVGVDVERVHHRPRALEIAARYFTGAEAEWLGAQPAPGRDTAFLRLWCAKEAVLKAHGRGLAFGLDRLRFEDAGHGLRLVACDPALGEPAGWTLREHRPEPGYVAAVAWRGE